MARLRLLDLAKPFVPALPEVQAPYAKLTFQERAMWVFVCGIFYNVLAELPLYGVVKPMELPDSIGWLRPVIAASNGTVVELGIMPVLLAGYILQIAAARRSLRVSLDLRSERFLFQSAQKLLALLIGAGLSLLLVFGGAYGRVSELGYRTTTFLLAQLLLGNLYVVISDELLSKGHGYGSGVLLYSTFFCAQKFTWYMLSFLSIDTAHGTHYFGALPNLAYKLWTRSTAYAIVDGVFRSDLPNAVDALTALIAFGAIIYLSVFRTDIRIRSTRMRNSSSTYPVRLLYTGCQPILFWAAALSFVRLVSLSLYRITPQNLLVRLLGTWSLQSHYVVADSGLLAYLQPLGKWPTNPFELARALVYFSSVLFIFPAFSLQWVGASGFGPVEIAKQFKDNGVVIQGQRETGNIKELRRIIPLAAATGGLVLAIYVGGLDVLAAPGWGAAVSVAVLNLFSFFELMSQEGYSPGIDF